MPVTSASKNSNPAVVSVIIPCYNHAHYLSQAVESVLNQSYQQIEIIVVDDGSKDNTREVAESYKDVKYVYQQNQGLSASRNTGIAVSSGAYLVFLDADDWLLPDAIATNIKYFNSGEKIGLVSGNYVKYNEETGELRPVERKIKHDVYADLLVYNHLTMHGSVMFPRFVFDRFKYDIRLRSSEDWDLTLAISRHYPVVQHEEPIAVRRKVRTSMSSNHLVMLQTGLNVLNKQKKHVRTSKERKNLKLGSKRLKQKFTMGIYQQIARKRKGNRTEVAVLLKYNPVLFFKYFYQLIKLKLVGS